MNQVIDMIKQNKKVVIILGVVLVAFLVLTVMGGNSGNTTGYFDTLTQLTNEDQYNGTIELSVGGKSVHMDIIKNGENYAVSVNLPDSGAYYNDLIVKHNGTVYFNSGTISSNGGLIALREIETEEETPNLISEILTSLSETTLTLSEDDSGATVTVGSTEEWSAFFTAIYNVLNDNSDAFIAGYKEKDACKALMNELTKAAKTAADTDTIANTLSSTLKVETVDNVRKYSGSFDFTADFAALPSFIDSEDFDTNQLKITAEIDITVGESNTAKPVGAVYDANTKTLPNFFIEIWENAFKKAEYIALNEVTVTSNSVYNKYDLGEVIEESYFNFDQEGVSSAEWIISSTNENIIEAYRLKYASNTKAVLNEETGVYSLVFYTTEEGLISLNKIGTTPKTFGEYLKTSKGGEIIV